MRELASLKEEHDEALRKGDILAEVWKHLQPLAGEDVPAAEAASLPADLSLFMDSLKSVETQLSRLRDERRENEERCAELTHTMETLQEQLDRKTSDQEETAAKIEELEQQILTMSERVDVPEPSSQDLSEAHKERILELEQQLREKDNELSTLQDAVRLAQEHSSPEAVAQVQDDGTSSNDSPAALPDLTEETQEEETTLVAEDTSVISIPGDDESSPELIGHQSDSPEESKGASSDEMVASSDSEVAHSSWTLLEAVNQDGGQEWPSVLQDFGQLQLQSWEATSMESETSTVQVESSSVVIRETVQVNVSQQGSLTADSSSAGQMFAQVLAEELQKRYSELLAELQRLKDAAAESQEKITILEEETHSLTAAKEEAESQTRGFEEELKSAREELDKLSQESSSGQEKHSVEIQLLEEQIEILTTDKKTKDETIQALQSDLEMAQQAFAEQEGRLSLIHI